MINPNAMEIIDDDPQVVALVDELYGEDNNAIENNEGQ